ncbi:MAG: DinB family protein [Promicromonosporaceae bacterium]|nr:DinB family protein [Promicromonosporaceae bacterium]
MNSSELLLDAFGRLPGIVDRVLADADDALLAFRPDPAANTIAWLVWHAARGIDSQVSDVAGTEQVWTAEGWADKLALPFPVSATGYGQSADEVAQVRASAALLGGYFAAVHAATTTYVRTLTDADLDRVVDTRWDPPVTLGVRLVSVLGDATQHAGQAAYVRGVFTRR